MQLKFCKVDSVQAVVFMDNARKHREWMAKDEDTVHYFIHKLDHIYMCLCLFLPLI